MSFNFPVENEPMWDGDFDFENDDDFIVSVVDDVLLGMPMEVEFDHHIPIDNEGQDLLDGDWDLTDEIDCSTAVPTIVSSSSFYDSESPRVRSPSPIRSDLLLLQSSSSCGGTGENRPTSSDRRTPPARTVSDNSTTSLQWQLQRNAMRFTDLMRRSDQTRSIVRSCRPHSSAAAPIMASSSSSSIKKTSSYGGESSEDEDVYNNILDEEDHSPVPHHPNFFESDKCRELERSRKQLYKLLSQNYM